MPRISRMVINDETTVYHIMSRTALDGFPLGDIEKNFMIDRSDQTLFASVFRLNFRGLHYLVK